jgi:hypothetical protein
MPFSTLIGADDEACELVGHGAIPAHLDREIAADAVLKRLVYDPLSGEPCSTTGAPPTDHPPPSPTSCVPATSTAAHRSAAAAPSTPSSTTSSPTPTAPPAPTTWPATAPTTTT